MQICTSRPPAAVIEGELGEEPGNSSRWWRSRPARAAAASGGANQPAARGGASEQQQLLEEKIRSRKEQAAVPWACGCAGWQARSGGSQGRRLGWESGLVLIFTEKNLAAQSRFPELGRPILKKI